MSRCQRRRPVGFWRADAISVLKLTRTQLSARNDYKIEIKKKNRSERSKKKGERVRERENEKFELHARACVCTKRGRTTAARGVSIYTQVTCAIVRDPLPPWREGPLYGGRERTAAADTDN